MSLFRVLLGTILVTLLVYTLIVISNHGLGLFQIFFGDIARMEWPGQFNLDFLGMLILSALWLMWRHHFRPVGILMGLFGLFGGVVFLSIYLLIASIKANGDVRVLLLGSKRAANPAD